MAEPTSGEGTQDLEALRDSLTALLGELEKAGSTFESARREVGRQLTAVQGVLERKEFQPAQPELQAPPGVDLTTLNESIQKLAMGNNQEEILDTLLQESQSFVRRAILFLNRGEQYLPWKGIGFPSDAMDTVTADNPDDPIVRSARQKRIIYRGERLNELYPWLGKAGDLPRVSICIPLVFDDWSPVVFYGDSNESIQVDSLEMLTHLTVLVLKNNYLHTLISGPARQAAGGNVVEFERPVPQHPFEVEETAPELEEITGIPDKEAPVEEEAAAPEEEGAFSADSSQPAQTTLAGADPVPPETPASPPPAATVQPGPLSREEEEKLHNEAQRFARLLISEIKLYNEEEVYNGRQKRDLYTRLKRDIDRSRDMFDRRVHPLVAGQVDYFHQELVRILANGDDQLLGREYVQR